MPTSTVRLHRPLSARAATPPAASAGLHRVLGSVALAAVCTSAAGLEVALPEYAIVITVPAVPAIAAQPQPAAVNPGAAMRLVGTDGTYRLDLAVFDQGKPVSARECAGARVRAIVAQPGMPNRDSVYRAALSPSTFLVIYAIERAGRRDLHAHLIGAAGSNHCADARLSRPARPGEDDDEWRITFVNARIEATPR